MNSSNRLARGVQFRGADSARVARRAAPAGPAVSAIVLAGGRARRLGRDKAAIPVGGVRVLDRVLSVLAGLCDDIVVVGRSVWSGAPTDVRFLEDQTPGQGPLGGLWTGLGAIRHERALVVGCDMPFLTGDLLRELLARSARADATVTRTGEQVQPLLAVYDRRVRPRVEQLLASKDRSLMALLRTVEVCQVDVGVGEWAAFSINSPQDLSRARKFVRERKGGNDRGGGEAAAEEQRLGGTRRPARPRGCSMWSCLPLR